MSKIRPQGLSPSLATATYVAQSALAADALAFGRKGGFVGDSITAGTGATNATTDAYVPMVSKIAGQQTVSPRSVNHGVSGDKAADVLARLPAILATSPAWLHFQVGTNDVGVTSLADFQTSITAIRALCEQANVPMSIGTIPAQGASLPSGLWAMNLWLRLWAPGAGVRLADVYGATVDPATGGMLAAYIASGVHPNPAGHLAIARAIAPVVAAHAPSQPWPVQTIGAGLVAYPLMHATGAWGVIGGGASQSLVAASNGDVPYGQWLRFTLDNTAGGSPVTKTVYTTLTAGWDIGDTLLVALYLRASNVDALSKVQMANQAQVVHSVLWEAAPSATPGPILADYTVPGGVSGLNLQITVTAPAGQLRTVDVGACNVFDLTGSGIAGTVTL